MTKIVRIAGAPSARPSLFDKLFKNSKISGSDMPYVDNVHVIKLNWLGATNTQPSRVKITSERFRESKIIPFNKKYDNIYEAGIDYLTKIGFNIIGKGEGENSSYLISDTFEPIK